MMTNSLHSKSSDYCVLYLFFSFFFCSLLWGTVLACIHWSVAILSFRKRTIMCDTVISDWEVPQRSLLCLSISDKLMIGQYSWCNHPFNSSNMAEPADQQSSIAMQMQVLIHLVRSEEEYIESLRQLADVSFNWICSFYSNKWRMVWYRLILCDTFFFRTSGRYSYFIVRSHSSDWWVVFWTIIRYSWTSWSYAYVTGQTENPSRAFFNIFSVRRQSSWCTESSSAFSKHQWQVSTQSYGSTPKYITNWMRVWWDRPAVCHFMDWQ